MRRVRRVDAAGCEEVHCSREADETGEEERGAGFHGDTSSGEDKAVFASFISDSGKGKFI